MSLNALNFFMLQLHPYSIACDQLLFFRVAGGFMMACCMASDGYGRIERLSSGGEGVNEGRKRECSQAEQASREGD